MKILFVDCSPSGDLQKVLEGNGIEIQKVPDPRTKGELDLVVWKLHDPARLSELASVRGNHPLSWIALIVPDSWLSQSSHYAALLAEEEKDDVWLESSWETGFWLALQRAIQGRAIRAREQELLETQKALLSASTQLVEKLESDADLAHKVHRKFYPKFSPDISGVQVLSKYLPGSGPGGDYFDLFEFGDKRRFGLLIADADSHRVAASLLTALLRLRLEDLKGRFSDSSAFVEHINETIAAEEPTSAGTLRLVYGVFDRGTLSLDVTCAGSILPRLIRQKAFSPLTVPTNAPLTGGTHWESAKIHLQGGDTLFFFTDGVVSGVGPDFESKVASLATQEPAQMRNRLIAEIEARQPKRNLKDDLTMVLLSVDEKALLISKPTLIRGGKKD